MHDSKTLVSGLMLLAAAGVLADNHSWSGWGGNSLNNRWAQNNVVVNSTSINNISQHCRIDYQYGVSATPVTVGDMVYYPTWNGSFVALNYVSCSLEWAINVTDLIVKFAPLNSFQKPALLIDPVSRTSPQIDGDTLFFATVTHALLIAVNRNTGAVLSSIQINPHPIASITSAPTFWNGSLYIGAASREESAAALAGYSCCSFIGNFVSLRFDATQRSFTVNWNITTLPLNQGWSGAAIWGSQPSIDASRGQVFFGTGNIYRDPASYEKCENQSSSCLPADILTDAIVAVDLATGKIRWSARPTPLDVWTVACGAAGIFTRNATVCPNTPGNDANFGMAPSFVPASASPSLLVQDIVVAGQKNGVLYAFSAADGSQLWSVQTSPGSVFAGLSWGVAADDSQVYFTGINALSTTFTLQPGGTSISNSCFGAASLRNGRLNWETQAPGDAIAQVPPTVVGDLVLVGRTGSDTNPGSFEETTGSLLALNKQTGQVVLNLGLNANFHGGIAVVDGYVMFGTGYAPFMGYTGNGSFYVMKVGQ